MLSCRVDIAKAALDAAVFVKSTPTSDIVNDVNGLSTSLSCISAGEPDRCSIAQGWRLASCNLIPLLVDRIKHRCSSGPDQRLSATYRGLRHRFVAKKDSRTHRLLSGRQILKGVERSSRDPEKLTAASETTNKLIKGV